MVIRAWKWSSARGNYNQGSGREGDSGAVKAAVDQVFSQFLFIPSGVCCRHGTWTVPGNALRPRTPTPNDPFVQGLRERYNDLQVERQVVLHEIATLDGQDSAEPRRATETELNVLDALPHLTTATALHTRTRST